jgi:hypothetical protein
MGRKLQEFFEVQYAQLPDDDEGDSPVAYNFHSADVVEVRAHVWFLEKILCGDGCKIHDDTAW